MERILTPQIQLMFFFIFLVVVLDGGQRYWLGESKTHHLINEMAVYRLVQSTIDAC